MPTHFKIVFYAEIFNEQDELLNTGEVSLFFVDAKTMKRCDMPLALREKLSRYFALES
jgi:acyl-CoA thioesterase FadM